MQKNIKMIKGDTLSFAVKITFDENVQNLSSAYFTVKENIDDSTPVFQKRLNNGISKIKVNGNKVYYRVRVAPEDTENILAKNYQYDLQIGLNDDVFTILKGTLKVDYDITN